MLDACDLSGDMPAFCCNIDSTEWIDLKSDIDVLVDSDILDSYIDEMIYLRGEVDPEAFRT